MFSAFGCMRVMLATLDRHLGKAHHMAANSQY